MIIWTFKQVLHSQGEQLANLIDPLNNLFTSSGHLSIHFLSPEAGY